MTTNIGPQNYAVLDGSEAKSDWPTFDQDRWSFLWPRMVLPYANAAARDAELAGLGPTDSAFAYLKDVKALTAWTGSVWRVVSPPVRTSWTPVIKNGSGTTISSTPTSGSCFYYVNGDTARVHAEVTINATAVSVTCSLPVVASQRLMSCGVSMLWGTSTPADQSGHGYMATTSTLVIAAPTSGYRDAAAGHIWRFDIQYPVA